MRAQALTGGAAAGDASHVNASDLKRMQLTASGHFEREAAEKAAAGAASKSAAVAKAKARKEQMATMEVRAHSMRRLGARWCAPLHDCTTHLAPPPPPGGAQGARAAL